ncbi:MAG: Gfo/Idh/MocA family oxidoreductase [Firmicutes bacterium]|nr:Gfo/Idh/MocA family oxidoreductase [Bacillota bacterium]
MDRVRVGVIGAGGIFQGAHLPAYTQVGEAKLVAICDVSEERLERASGRLWAVFEENARTAEARAAEGHADPALARRLREDAQEVKVYKDYGEMLRSEGLDMVDVCTPPNLHARTAIDALQAGCHVLVEKPMAHSWLDCVDMVQAVQSTGRFYHHGENWLFEPSWYNARKFIEAGVVGEVGLTFLATAHGGPEWAAWFWDPEISGGGALLDNGIHAITTSWFLAGFDRSPTLVKAAAPVGVSTRMRSRVLQGQMREVKVEDDAHVLIRFDDKESGAWTTCHVEGSWCHRDGPDTSVIGTHGRITFFTRDGQHVLCLSDPFEKTREVVVGSTGGASSFAGEIRNLCVSIQKGERPLCDERIGADSQAIVGASYLSQAWDGRAVSPDEFKEFALGIKRSHGSEASRVLVRELHRLKAGKPA